MSKATKILFIILFILISHTSTVNSQVALYGGRGLMRVFSANVITPADIYVNGYLSMYFEKISSKTLAKYYAINLSGTFGLTRYLEASCHLIPYQDDQTHIFGRFGDSELAIKYMLPFSVAKFQMGLQGFFKFPTAQIANVPYEVFSSDKYGWGGRALLTFDLSNTLGSFPLKMYSNIGYFDHDISDIFFTSEVDQMLIGVGIKFPVRSTQFYLEYTGEIFVNADSVAYNENSNRITPGVKFLGPWGFSIDVVGDISLTKRNPQTDQDIFHKKYTKWRIWVGLTYRFSVYKYFDKNAKLAKKKKEQELKKLERIKNRRKKANKDMKKMKEILKKKNPGNS